MDDIEDDYCDSVASYTDSGYQYPVYDDEPMDDIINTSPCLSERYPQQTSYYPQNDLDNDEDIAEYDLDDYNEPTLQYPPVRFPSQSTSYFTAKPKTPNFGRVPHRCPRCF